MSKEILIEDNSSIFEVGESSKKWGDLELSSSENEEEAEEEPLQPVIEEILSDPPASLNNLKESERDLKSILNAEACSCIVVNNNSDCLNSMQEMSETIPNFENLQCIINNIIASYNYIFFNNDDLYSEYRAAFADLFYRVRHEVLFKLLCLSINESPTASDTPFSDYGLDSKRTPDKIVVRGDCIIIVEVTATSSFEKAAAAKGMKQMGFESKYKKELDLLKDIFKNVLYLPLFFNMSDLYNPIQEDQIAELYENFECNKGYFNLLKQAARGFSHLSLSLKDSLVLPSSIIFSDLVDVEKQHPSHEFLYTSSIENKDKVSYNELTISNPVYRKICDLWDRLEGFIDRKDFVEETKIRFLLETGNHRLEIEKSRLGCKVSEMRAFISKNDKVGVFRNTFLKMGRNTIRCTESETGVKLLEPTFYKNDKLWTKCETVADHQNKRSVKWKSKYDVSKYLSKCNGFKSDSISCKFYDPNYENTIIQAICSFDRSMDMGKGDKRLSETDFGVKLLGQMDIKPDVIKTELSKIRVLYDSANRENDGIPRTLLKCKSPFILPIGDFNQTSYCKLDFKNGPLINKVSEVCAGTNEYTNSILDRVIKDSYKMYTERKTISDPLQSLLNQRMECSNELNRLYKKCKKENPALKRLKDLASGTDKEVYNIASKKFSVLNKEIKKRSQIEGVGKDISYIRLPTKKPHDVYHSVYKSEMQHFKNKKIQSTTEGVGIIDSIEADYKKDFEIFKLLNELLMEYRGENPDKLYDDYVSPDSRLLNNLKQASTSRYKEAKESFENSTLGHSCSFISRLAHSLMFYSQQSFSSDYVRVDNLGYKNVLLIVRGGKKIFKSKSSKLFRLVIPISNVLLDWYKPQHSDKGSSMVFMYEGVSHLLTPWAYLHENVLSDSISFYQRVGSFTILNLDPHQELKKQFHKLQLNVLLAFHNRRQTEVLLANLRYILLSTMGEFTGLQEILKDFFGFNYDCFQSFIRNSILCNYQSYFNSLYHIRKSSNSRELTEGNLKNSGLTNIFTKSQVDKVEDLALMIYSTFLMTKAPYQKLVERANNLKGILNIHDYYVTKVGSGLTPEAQMDKLNVECKTDYVGYSRELFKNDFNFDAKYCALIGNFMDSYFKNNFERDVFHVEWIRIQNSNWDEMATSTGLRGDYETVEDFWGQKGYFVVYKTLLKNTDFKNSLFLLFNDGLSDNEKRKILKSLNRLYKESHNENEFLIFHAVDKTQWRGGREIYVMDIYTKIMQQPIEKFMGFVCSKMDNELISIPSNKRAQVIHHSIFEKDLPLKEMMTWYLTLDCSKWAPKSIFAKFAVCINNMECIPNSFKVHLLNYFEKLYNKRLYFNVKEVEVLKSNIAYREVCEKYLIEDKKVNGYYLPASYTWVMGIFNYMSSFLHAANQKYFSYILSRSTQISFNEDCTLTMFAHSDDSGGRITVSNPSLLKRALILYEINLHSANHLISRKKSVVSKIYFEILSVIYLFKKLLALLPKFLGGLRFLPTDKGPAQDILQSYSKCIEVIIAGADFSIAYIVLKMMAYLVYRFYFNKKPTESDYTRPGQYLGIPDAHPIMCLLCGTDADIIRICSQEGGEQELINQMAFVNCIIENNDGEGPIKPLKFAINIKNLNKDFGVYIEFFSKALEMWSPKNVNFHSTGMNTLSFLAKLNDPGFVGSLINESQVRRISRSYHHRISNSLLTKFGLIKINTFVQAMRVYSEYQDKNSAIQAIFERTFSQIEIDRIVEESVLNKEKSIVQMDILKRTVKSPMKLLKYFDRLSLDGRALIPSNRTLKPAMVQLNKGGQIFSVDFDPTALVSYIKEPDLSWALGNLKNINTAKLELDRYVQTLGWSLESLTPDILLRICRSFGRENVKNIYIYSRTPGDMRQIKTYTAFLTFLSVNSFQNEEIEGLTVNVSDKDSAREYVTTRVSETSYLINNIINVLLLFHKKCGHSHMSLTTIRPIDDLSFLGGDVQDLIECLGININDSIEGSFCLLQYYLLRSIHNLKKPVIEDLKRCSYYIFTKEQKIRSGWYGEGEIYINVAGSFYSFKIRNNIITELQTNCMGKLDQMHEKFILDVIDHLGLNLPRVKPKMSKNNKNVFGYDLAGGLGVFNSREVSRGVPCNYRESLGGLVSELDYFNVSAVHKDHVFMRNPDTGAMVKVYFLPLKKVELVDTIRQLFEPQDFEPIVALGGLSDFEDYVMTEIMPDYGVDLFVTFDQFIDNYSSSKSYEIIKECSQNSYSRICNTIEYSNVPAQEGSLTRILIDYSNATGNNVIKTYKRVDADIMRLRSEYPDQVSVILLEKLTENYNNMYTIKEIKEITDGYMKLLETENPDLKKIELIKMMCYWGFSSLVNNIEQFKLIRSPSNYIYFNYENCCKNNLNIYSNLYPRLIKEILTLMENHHTNIDDTAFLVKNYKTLYKPSTLKTNYIKNLCYATYNTKVVFYSSNLIYLYFNNLFLNLMLDEDFVAELQEIFHKDHVLSSIPVNSKYRNDLLVLLNTLCYAWFKANINQFDLNYTVRLQRYPDNIQTPSSVAKQFGISLPSGMIYYNGFLNSDILNWITSGEQIVIKGVVYNLKHKIKKLSRNKVPINQYLRPELPLLQEVLESEDWDEILSECSMGDLDGDTILDYWEGISPKYQRKKTKMTSYRGKKVVDAEISWVVLPDRANRPSALPFLRQCGENVAVLTNSIMEGFTHNGNTCMRIIKVGEMKEPVLCYYLFQKELLDDRFIDQMLSPHKLDYNKDIKKRILINHIRDSDGVIKDSGYIGTVVTAELMSGVTVLSKKDDIVTVESNPDLKKEEDKDSELNNKSSCANPDDDEDPEVLGKLELLKRLDSVLDEMEAKLGLDKETLKNIKQKYTGPITKGIGIKTLFNSVLGLKDLMTIQKEILDGDLDLTKSQRSNMMSNPSHFGGVSGGNLSLQNPVKDKKLKSEMDSMAAGTSKLVISSKLTISPRMRNLINSNYKLWVRYLKTSNFKTENKIFLLQYLIMLTRSAKPDDETEYDNYWQDCINNCTNYFSQDAPDIESELADLFQNLFLNEPGARIRYRALGVPDL